MRPKKEPRPQVPGRLWLESYMVTQTTEITLTLPLAPAGQERGVSGLGSGQYAKHRRDTGTA